MHFSDIIGNLGGNQYLNVVLVFTIRETSLATI